MQTNKNFILIVVMLMQISCSSMMPDGPPAQTIDVSKIANAVPKLLPLSQYGNASYTVYGKRYYPLKSAKGYDKRGIASWYGTKFNGQLTSSGEPYNLYAMTGASKILPLPTFVQVTNLENGRKVIIKINDRGPFEKNRILDLSYVAAKKLAMLKKGTALVEVKAINPRTWHKPSIHLAQKSKPQKFHPHQHKIYLQVGAFDNKKNAQQLSRQLHAFFKQPTHIEPLKVGNHVVYKVQIGPLANVSSSDKLSAAIERYGFGEAIVRVN